MITSVANKSERLIYFDCPDIVSLLVASSLNASLRFLSVEKLLAFPISAARPIFNLKIRELFDFLRLYFLFFRGFLVTRSYYERWQPLCNSTLNEVLCGDAILSFALRGVTQPSSHLFFSLKVFNAIIKFNLRYLKYKYILNLGCAYHVIWEANYLDKYLDRCLLLSGSIRILLSYTPEKLALYSNKVLKRGFDGFLKAKAYNIDTRVSQATNSEIFQLATERCKSLNNITFLRNLTIEELSQFSCSYYAPTSSDLKDTNNAIVFAHSFSDAQLLFSPSLFIGMLDWLTYTVQSLLDIGYIVYVKPHPFFAFRLNGVSHSGDKIDRIVWNSFLKKYSKRLRILDINTRPLDLYSSFGGNAIYISHHGSVIPEIAFLGGCTVSSVASPWGQDYNIGCAYRSLSEYKEILQYLYSKNNRSSPNSLETIAYFNDYCFLKGQYKSSIYSVPDALLSVLKDLFPADSPKTVADLLMLMGTVNIQSMLSSNVFKKHFVRFYADILADSLPYLTSHDL